MRGLHNKADISKYLPGITPAHAGLTRIFICVQCSIGDHPRACGAYYCFVVAQFEHSGSPPRMRGLLLKIRALESVRGITPAHAGLTHIPFFDVHICRDHPRACGAYQRLSCPDSVCRGSPPRMRGLLNMSEILHNGTGITPAHAGLTAHTCAA